MFQRLESVLHSEVRTLGFPRAALLAFGVAVAAYNVLSLIQTAVRVKHARTLVDTEAEISPYYIATEIRETYAGMMIAVPERQWKRYESVTVKELTKILLGLAAQTNPMKLRSHPRKPKVPKKKGYVAKRAAQQHVATSRVIVTGRIK